MAKTIADVVKKTTTTNKIARKKSAPAVEEQRFPLGKLLLIAAPCALLAACGTAALALRRWLSNDDDGKR